MPVAARSRSVRTSRGSCCPWASVSILGAVVGGYLVPYVPARALKLALGAILVASTVHILRHVEGTRRATSFVLPVPVRPKRTYHACAASRWLLLPCCSRQRRRRPSPAAKSWRRRGR